VRELFNERLKQKRKEKGLSQAELARRVGVGRDSYNKYEKTVNRPSYETLMLLAEELNTTIDYLLGNSKTPAYNNEVLNAINNRNELKTLFNLAINATKEDIEVVNNLLKRMTNNT